MQVYRIEYSRNPDPLSGNKSSVIHMLVGEGYSVGDIFNKYYPTCNIVKSYKIDDIDHLVVDSKYLS